MDIGDGVAVAAALVAVTSLTAVYVIAGRADARAAEAEQIAAQAQQAAARALAEAARATAAAVQSAETQVRALELQREEADRARQTLRAAQQANVTPVSWSGGEGLVVRNDGPGTARRVRAEFRQTVGGSVVRTAERASLVDGQEHAFNRDLQDVTRELQPTAHEAAVPNPTDERHIVARAIWNDAADGARRQTPWRQFPIQSPDRKSQG